MSSAISFNLDQSKILSFGKELRINTNYGIIFNEVSHVWAVECDED